MAQYAVFLHFEQVTGESSAEHQAHSDELASSGAMVAAFALEPPTTAKVLRGTLVTDGPFAESKEVVGGLYVLEAPDLDAAVEIARRNPLLREGGALEVRPIAGSRIVTT